MNKFDYHIHTNFSSDSDLNPEELIKKAIGLNYREIAFTDHLDLNPIDLKKYGKLNTGKYYNVINDLKVKYSKHIDIKTGLEIGEYHRYKDNIKNIVDIKSYDIIIGSIHRTKNNTNMSVSIKKPFDISTINDYYKANYELVKNSDIDILGHMGIFQRYYKDYDDISDYYDIIEKIFNYMQLNKIALEINFSGLRKNLNNIIPSLDVIKLYIKKGGNLITIGSDIHTLNDFRDEYYQKAINILKNNRINFLSIKKENKWKNFEI